ncbi:MAG: Gfo/Idh/MocA family oxidoreductase, partial [Desulfobacterales bacterium]|nr:Gfo/Idh/MocA family oxidoreductase [Desulfobacterales bacterium]
MPDPGMKHLVVGAGSIGKRHAGILMKNGKDVAAVDPYASGQLDFPVLETLKEGLEWDPDMVWLCSPTELHAEQACEVIRAGVPLFIEKPLAHTIEAAFKIKQAFLDRRQKPPVWVGCNMRYHPAVIRLKNSLDNGRIGRPLIFRIHFSHWLPNMRPGTDYRNTYAAGKTGGGIILDDIHDIDLALWFAGEVKSAAGLAGHSGMLDMAAEDIAGFSLKHKNGAFTHLHMDFLRKDKSRGIEV